MVRAGWSIRIRHDRIGQFCYCVALFALRKCQLQYRAELLAAAPDVYYVTDHYLAYSAVLVRLSRIKPDILRDLLGMAH
jgi:hypothetical protein